MNQNNSRSSNSTSDRCKLRADPDISGYGVTLAALLPPLLNVILIIVWGFWIGLPPIFAKQAAEADGGQGGNNGTNGNGQTAEADGGQDGNSANGEAAKRPEKQAPRDPAEKIRELINDLNQISLAAAFLLEFIATIRRKSIHWMHIHAILNIVGLTAWSTILTALITPKWYTRSVIYIPLMVVSAALAILLSTEYHQQVIESAHNQPGCYPDYLRGHMFAKMATLVTLCISEHLGLAICDRRHPEKWQLNPKELWLKISRRTRFPDIYLNIPILLVMIFVTIPFWGIGTSFKSLVISYQKFKHYLSQSEEEWTLGQIMPLGLVVIAIIQAFWITFGLDSMIRHVLRRLLESIKGLLNSIIQNALIRLLEPAGRVFNCKSRHQAMEVAYFKPSYPSHYGYTPLPSERSIRLVQILQETSSGIPQCHLTTISLDYKPFFIALSYTWGRPSDQTNISADRCCRIFCNGRSLAVTQNLFNFLKRARPGGLANWLSPDDRIWIDAICINQDNLDERSSQVMLMADIYRSARTVIVWLGEQEIETHLAVELLERLSAAPSDKLRDLKNLQVDDPRMLEVLGKCGGSITHWRALKRMFSRTWFSRVWVIQEIAFAENIVILCGGFSLSWENCIEACEFLSYSVLNDLQLSKIPYAGWNAEALAMFQASNSNDLLTVLINSRGFEASDPRDKIYAVLGLASLGPTPLPAAEIIRPDYKLTPAEVFLDVARGLIRESDNLNFLAEVEDPQHREVTDIPSWVPDFSSTYRPSIYHQSLAFKADGGLKKSVLSLSNPQLLGTAAYRLGEVVYAGSLGVNEPFIEYFPRMLMPLFELSPIYITGEDRLEVLWRTMIQNGLDWVSPAAADTAKKFRDWILLNIVEAAIQNDKSMCAQELLGQVMTHLENYSKIDPTGIMPTPQDVYAATAKLSDRVKEHSFEQTSPRAEYEHELMFYQHMCLFRTNNGLLGLGQPSLQTGDSLWIIPGVSVPMVLKNTSVEARFTVLGPAYVYGIMFGEALEREQLDYRSIILE